MADHLTAGRRMPASLTAVLPSVSGRLFVGPVVPPQSRQKAGHHPVQDVRLGHQALVETEPGHHLGQDHGAADDDILPPRYHTGTVETGLSNLGCQRPVPGETLARLRTA